MWEAADRVYSYLSERISQDWLNDNVYHTAELTGNQKDVIGDITVPAIY